MEIAQPLFCTKNTQAASCTAARLSASCTSPSLVAPSPQHTRVTPSSSSQRDAIAAPTAWSVCVPMEMAIGATQRSTNPRPPCHAPRHMRPTPLGSIPRTRYTPSSRYWGNTQSLSRMAVALPTCAASCPRAEA